MPPLPTDLRSSLEKSILTARDRAEDAARASLNALAVQQPDAFPNMDGPARKLRNALRAKARQYGNGSRDKGIPFLEEEIAYEQWNRMLFARFLAENNLLMHPSSVAVTLQDCEELAAEEGEADAWQLAARYASAMLPGIFRTDDPAVSVRFAPEGRNALETILNSLPTAIFTADDSLGWVYQFWQTKKKKEVNESGRKVGAADLAPVTQLFTEHYMVQFLLENSLGAWWVARHPASPLVKTFTYLRFLDDGTPAAGAFPGWPDRAAEVTVMDPCCGSGHFLVSAFDMLCRMRMEEEGLSERDATDAVLRDNLFGLEIDPRCVQIAAFALAFAAWKAGGYRPLPLPNIACSGIPVVGQLDTWTRLAGDDQNLRTTLERLYYLFQQAPTLGSLINPADVPLRDRMFTPDYGEVAPVLQRALAKERNGEDPVAGVFGAAAEGVLKASRLLACTYTLVITNVPFLPRVRQSEILREFVDTHVPEAKADLSSAFLLRCRAATAVGGHYAVVTPQSWRYLGAFRELRLRMLREQVWVAVINLGTRAFQTPMYDFNIGLTILANLSPSKDHCFFGIDVSDARTASEKARSIQTIKMKVLNQATQLENPDAIITLQEARATTPLSDLATSGRGLGTGDGSRFNRFFWEPQKLDSDWDYLQGTVSETEPYGGRAQVILWQQAKGELYELAQSLKHLNHSVQNWRRGQEFWGRHGIAVSQMGRLPVSLYSGDKYDENTAVIAPSNPDHLAAIWAFCRSSEYHEAIRRIDQSLKVTSQTLIKVPFDLNHWQKVANEAGPLPEPFSNDPTQWLFKGDPVNSTEPLQVAVARLLGYNWPQQEPDRLDRLADADGIACLPPVAGEQPAAERLRALLSVAYGSEWSPAVQDRLLAAVGFAGKGLDDWLRDGFFAQHCKLFHNRPFIWHIWDGRKDGFSALVNYHKLDYHLLGSLIYKYLGQWIALQKDQSEHEVAGADGRLVAALQLKDKLEAIQKGEPPYDIYVRWKPLHRQPIGWNPDLNDGVRLNIRPFVTAGVLRSKFTINWNKDRGANPDGSERLNDPNPHPTVAQKQEARRAAGL